MHKTRRCQNDKRRVRSSRAAVRVRRVSNSVTLQFRVFHGPISLAPRGPALQPLTLIPASLGPQALLLWALHTFARMPCTPVPSGPSPLYPWPCTPGPKALHPWALHPWGLRPCTPRPTGPAPLGPQFCISGPPVP